MEALECLKGRRSIRKFTDQKVTEEDITKIVDAAKFAPSWKNSQTVRYAAILTPEVKDQIADEAVLGFAWNTGIMKAAPAMVAIVSVKNRSGYERDGSFSTSQGTHWESFDAGLASEAFCLAAHAYGLATVILGIFDQEKVSEILGLAENEKVSAMIPIGYAAESPEAPKRKDTEALVRFL